MKEQLIHILDQSVCLSRKQMKEYLSGAMLPEEAHAAEIHLCACPLCSMAMEGFEQHSDEALAAIASLNSGFLKEHFANIAPQIHLNSLAPAAAMPAARGREREKGRIQPIWRVASVAAGALMVFGLLWAIERSGRHMEPSPPTRLATARNGGHGSDGSSPAATVAVAPAHASDAVPPVHAVSSNAAAATTAPATQRDAAPAAATTVSGALQTPPAAAKDAASKPIAANTPATAPVTAVDAASKDAKTAAAGKPTVTDPPALKIFKEYNEPAEAQDESTDPKKSLTAATGGAATRQRALAAEASKAKAPATRQPEDQRSEMERGNAFYDNSNYNAALVHFKKELNNANARTRNQAAMMAAQCYIALGNSAKAAELLQRVVDNGSGPERRSARRTLRRLK